MRHNSLHEFIRWVIYAPNNSYRDPVNPETVFQIIELFIDKGASISSETKVLLDQFLDRSPNQKVKAIVEKKHAECVIM